MPQVSRRGRAKLSASRIEPPEGSLANISLEHEDGCVRLRLVSGGANTLTTAVMRELSSAIEAAGGSARGTMLCGGDKFFSNGVDLDWALGQPRAGIREMFLELGHLVLALLESPRPVVGVVRGHATGAGLALFLACDYRYAATGRVLLGKPEIRLGVPNPYYGDQLLRFVAGDFVASDLICTGKLIPADEGRALGLVHETRAKGEIEKAAWEKLLSLRDLAPAAFAESKRMRLGRFCADLRDQMSSRVTRQVEIWHGEDAQARLRAAADRLRR